MIRGLTTLCLALLAAASGAGPIYKTTDANGNVVYTDDPGDRPAEAVDLPELTIVPATPLAGPTPRSNEALPDLEPTPLVTLLAPEPGATLRSNTGDVEVVARVDQPLADGDRFEALIDGAVRARNAAGVFALTGIDRGEHRVSVRLIDGDGEVRAASASHTFYLHQRSRLHP
ncbi:MAG: DUF4124 domain-containing protein [Pseudomonadales bacterium]|nr:DUF4124 domain-containing protein [Pseudomonadales bacterium]